MSERIFCYAPWTNLGIRPSGRLSPCCKFIHDSYETFDDSNINIRTHTIAEYKNSKALQSVKDDFLAGRWPKGCKKCQIEEESGLDSKRIMDYNRWKEHYDVYKLDSGETITANAVYGTTCNLKCIMCNPVVSSSWRKEWNEIYHTQYQDYRFYNESFVNEFIDNGPNLVHMDTTGGEPLLSGVEDQHTILKHYINTGRAKEMTLHYVTNVTLIPSDQWWEIWSHFKEVDIQLSIDGTGSVFEYQRFPGSWEETLSIVNYYINEEKARDNIRLSVSHTVSAYNLYYLDSFLSWCDTIGLPKPWISIVHSPNHLRPGVWPADIKTEIMSHLRSSTNDEVHKLADFLQNDNAEQYFSEFLEFTKTHNTYRNIDFSNALPEINNLLEKGQL